MPVQGCAEDIDARLALAEEPAVVVPPDAYLWAAVPRGVMYTSEIYARGALPNNVKRIDWTSLLPVEVLLEVRLSRKVREQNLTAYALCT